MIIQKQFSIKMIFLLVLSKFQLSNTCKIKGLKFESKTEFKYSKYKTEKQKTVKKIRKRETYLLGYHSPAAACRGAQHHGPTAPVQHGPNMPRYPFAADKDEVGVVAFVFSTGRAGDRHRDGRATSRGRRRRC